MKTRKLRLGDWVLVTKGFYKGERGSLAERTKDNSGFLVQLEGSGLQIIDTKSLKKEN